METHKRTRRTRKAVVAGGSLLVAGMMLSACGPNDTSGVGNSRHGSAPSDRRPGTVRVSAADEQMNGTITGRLKFFEGSPGGFTVTTADKRTLGFSMAKGAEMTGWDTVCGQPGERITCTERQLQSWTTNEKVFARVTLNRGVATAVSKWAPHGPPPVVR